MAFFSDVHGHLAPLEAVLAELARRAVVDVYAAGDHLFGGDEPHEVWLRLVGISARLARGVGDEALAAVDPSRLVPKDDAEKARLERFLATRRAVGELVVQRLMRLPTQVRVPLLDGSELVMVHGSPADPRQEMSHELDDEELLALVGDDPADIVVCGGSHVPFQRDVSGVRIVNVGSVGEAPGGRVAHYTIVTPRADGTLIEQAHVEW